MDDENLTSAILALTKELKRYNDANEPVVIREREAAEYFRGAYSQAEIEKREISEGLSKLTPAGEEPIGEGLGSDGSRSGARKTRRRRGSVGGSTETPS